MEGNSTDTVRRGPVDVKLIHERTLSPVKKFTPRARHHKKINKFELQKKEISRLNRQIRQLQAKSDNDQNCIITIENALRQKNEDLQDLREHNAFLHTDYQQELQNRRKSS